MIKKGTRLREGGEGELTKGGPRPAINFRQYKAAGSFRGSKLISSPRSNDRRSPPIFLLIDRIDCYRRGLVLMEKKGRRGGKEKKAIERPVLARLRENEESP